MNWIVSFCASCGTLVSRIKQSECDKCKHSVTDKKNRIEGTFTNKEAQRLLTAYNNHLPANDRGDLDR